MSKVKMILILRETSNIMVAIVLIHLIFLAITLTTLTTPIMVITDIMVTMIITIMGIFHQQFLLVGMSLYLPLFCQLEFV
jgi:hypothetical protein